MRKRIGDFFMDRGLLTSAQVHEVLRHSRSSGLRFGEAAMDLGLLDRARVVEVFGPNWTVDFFHLEPDFFPESTRELLPIEMMIRLGSLPLGFKLDSGILKRKRILNLGLINPARTEAAEEIEEYVRKTQGESEIQGVKVYLIIADQFLAILDRIYGYSTQKIESDLQKNANSQIDETLTLFLGD